jgi:hypothetical protein
MNEYTDNSWDDIGVDTEFTIDEMQDAAENAEPDIQAEVAEFDASLNAMCNILDNSNFNSAIDEKDLDDFVLYVEEKFTGFKKVDADECIIKFEKRWMIYFLELEQYDDVTSDWNKLIEEGIYKWDDNSLQFQKFEPMMEETQIGETLEDDSLWEDSSDDEADNAMEQDEGQVTLTRTDSAYNDLEGWESEYGGDRPPVHKLIFRKFDGWEMLRNFFFDIFSICLCIIFSSMSEKFFFHMIQAYENERDTIIADEATLARLDLTENPPVMRLDDRIAALAAMSAEDKAEVLAAMLPEQIATVDAALAAMSLEERAAVDAALAAMSAEDKAAVRTTAADRVTVREGRKWDVGAFYYPLLKDMNFFNEFNLLIKDTYDELIINNNSGLEFSSDNELNMNEVNLDREIRDIKRIRDISPYREKRTDNKVRDRFDEDENSAKANKLRIALETLIRRIRELKSLGIPERQQLAVMKNITYLTPDQLSTLINNHKDIIKVIFSIYMEYLILDSPKPKLDGEWIHEPDGEWIHEDLENTCVIDKPDFIEINNIFDSLLQQFEEKGKGGGREGKDKRVRGRGKGREEEGEDRKKNKTKIKRKKLKRKTRRKSEKLKRKTRQPKKNLKRKNKKLSRKPKKIKKYTRSKR